VPTAYLLGMSRANWHALFKNDQDLPAGYFAGQIGGYFSKVPCWVWVGGIGGYFLKAFTTYLLGMSQVNCFKTHKKLTMYPLGKLPFAPSVYYESGTRNLPVSIRAYVDDHGLHAISNDLETNVYLLRKALESLVGTFTAIGMSIDPDKCDLMHFSWRRGETNPPLKTTLYGKPLVVIPPSSIRWLGFHLDRKLSFRHHVSLLTKKGKAIVSGLKVLGNTVAGISPSNLRLLYKTVIIPAITYGSQLWFNPDRPNRKLIEQLKKVQHQALKQVAGAFYDAQEEALQILTYVPPITTTLHKLYRSAALRIPRLPLTSEITRRLPADYLPSDAQLTQRVIPPKHIPFARPRANEILSPLTRMVATFNSHTKRAEPFHNQNAPHHQRLSSHWGQTPIYPGG